MGFLSWLFCAILVVALVLLLFPFAFRIDFEVGERGARALFFFFKKKVYEYEKKWKDGLDEKRDAPAVEAVAKKPAETPKTEHLETSAEQPSIRSEVEDTPEKRESLPPSSSKQSEGDPVKSCYGNESAQPAKVKSSLVVEVSSDAKVSESENRDSEKSEKPAKKTKLKKEKRKLSDREFWTIILTPDFDARAFKYILKILKAVLTLFRVRFSDCFVEGIRTDYQTMGYIAAVNGFLKAYPYVGDWDLRMDWCSEKDLRAVGSVR